MKFVCSCCDRSQVGEPVRRKSSLTKTVTWNFCEVCAESEHEPRHWLILTGRSNGVNAVRKHIKARKYCGDPILAEELL
jgi:hypothetical protein